MSTLKALWQQHEQAIWLDYIQRSLVSGGGLQRLVEEDGIRGVTSNPSIFEKAIAGSDDYDDAVTTLLAERPQITTTELYETLAIEDIRMAADVLRAVFDSSGGSDGFVSLEVSPHLAHDSKQTVEEARRLWRMVDRPNLMIKVPATQEGLPAIETLIGEGINVNVTLMFSLGHYEAVAERYLRGVERCAQPDKVASVASFFVSRLDTVVDRRLGDLGTPQALELRGRTAIANCCLTYRRFHEIFHGDPFRSQRDRGARVQRPLWASTSTKNPSYSDVIYVENLIGSETVNTLPTATIEAFRDHGTPQPGLEQGMAGADEVLAGVSAQGIDLVAVTEQLQVDGVAAFATSFDQLMAALEAKRSA